MLALGDTAYPLFCKTGEDVDKQLQHLGAQRIAALQKCDLDYESAADQWFDTVLQQLQVSENKVPVITAPTETKKPAGKLYYDGIVQTHINLTARGSSKKVYHIELVAEGVDFLPGDSIGIVRKMIHCSLINYCNWFRLMETVLLPGKMKQLRSGNC